MADRVLVTGASVFIGSAVAERGLPAIVVNPSSPIGPGTAFLNQRRTA